MELSQVRLRRRRAANSELNSQAGKNRDYLSDLEFEATELLGQVWSQELVSISLPSRDLHTSQHLSAKGTDTKLRPSTVRTMLDAEGDGFD